MAGEKARLGLNVETASRYLVTQQVGGLYEGIKEMVQNAIDSGPSRINIDLRPEDIIISDNGYGMSVDTLRNNYLNFFNSSKDSGSIGRFGIGGKALIGHKKVDSIETMTTSSQTKKKVAAKMFMEDGIPTYVLGDEENAYFGHGTTIDVKMKDNMDDREMHDIFKGLRRDLFAVAPEMHIVYFDGCIKRSAQAGGVKSFQQLARNYGGVYANSEHGEAVAFEMKNHDFPLETSTTHHTIRGLRIFEEYNKMEETIIITNIPEGNRVISSTNLVESDKEHASQLEDLVLDKFTIDALRTRDGEKKKKALTKYLKRRISKSPDLGYDHEAKISTFFAKLPKEISEAKVFDGYAKGDYLVSLNDVIAMEEENKGHIYFASAESGGRVDSLLRNNSVSFISNKELTELLRDLSWKDYKSNVVDVAKNVRPSDYHSNRGAALSLSMKGFLRLIASPKEFSRSLQVRTPGDWDSDIKIDYRGIPKALLRGMIAMPAAIVYSPRIVYDLIKNRNTAEKPKPELKVKESLTKIEKEAVRSIRDAIKDAAKDYGIHLPNIDVLGINLELPGREDTHIPYPDVIAFYNGENIVMNYNNPSVKSLEKIARSGRKEDAKLAAQAMLLTTVAHEKTHKKEKNHDLDFYKKAEENQQDMVDKIMATLEKSLDGGVDHGS